ncbi:hypothetical protein Dfri01_68700 [Dyadobacter frigoris]|uniref:hypothetical protein n=1 Tax=Dyadobacter frigoris TaxID=2576211 RepID=UPI0024A20888|nr:hypothetical protein [Dyadobacter frigoris]GLU57409.1 hypothetical protein Dfri01_68700 [Dyadobacter frigoris]
MKPLTWNKSSIDFSKIFLLIFTVIILQSCDSQKYNFAISQVVPAAEGSVEVKQDDNSNYEIDLNIARLAEPKRLTPARKLYVVWVQTEKNGDKNIGQLKTSSSLFSNTLKSSLTTVTSYKPIGFLISAEDDANIQSPGGQVVLRTSH